MNVLLDTNIFIEYFRGSEQAKEYLKRLITEEEVVYFSAISEAELICGKSCNTQETKEKVLHLLSLFNKIHVDNKVAQLAGDIRRRYDIALPDALIAASALVSESVLMTKNMKDFRRIEGLLVKPPY